MQSLQLSLRKVVSGVWPQLLVKRAQRVPVRFQWFKSEGVDQLVGQQIRNKLMGCNIADQVITSSRIFLNDLLFMSFLNVESYGDTKRLNVRTSEAKFTFCCDF